MISNKIGADIERVSHSLFLEEGLLFNILCLFKRVENKNMQCLVRLHKGEIQYNPEYFPYIPDTLLKEELICLLIRIMCHHTDHRRPEGITSRTLMLASDCVMHGFFDFSMKKLANPDYFQLPEGLDLEFYAFRIQSNDDEQGKGNSSPQSGIKLKPDTSENDGQNSKGDSENEGRNGKGNSENEGQNGKGNSPQCESAESDPVESLRKGQMTRDQQGEYAEGWEEDPFTAERVRQEVQHADLVKNWGSISGGAKEKIKACQEPKLDYRDMLRGFQASIISSPRNLTRMKPNRRTGFTQMGSKRSLQSKLLVAIDTSGSVCSKSLEGFYAVINHLFRFGVDEIDVVQFDCEVTTPFQTIKKAQPEVEVMGRGGTNFQAVLNKVMEEKRSYDGILFFTDGYAPCPKIPLGMRAKIFWLMDSESNWKDNKESLGKTGRTAWMSLEKEEARLKI